MKTEKIVKEVSSAVDSLRGCDPVMMKKKFVMEDSLYRKSTPGHEIAHAEVALDCKFCLVTAALIAALAVTVLAICKLCRRR